MDTNRKTREERARASSCISDPKFPKGSKPRRIPRNVRRSASSFWSHSLLPPPSPPPISPPLLPLFVLYCPCTIPCPLPPPPTFPWHISLPFYSCFVSLLLLLPLLPSLSILSLPPSSPLPQFPLSHEEMTNHAHRHSQHAYNFKHIICI